MSTDINEAKNSSTPAFVTALVFNAAVFGIQFLVFTIIRRRFKAIYEPRTYVPLKHNRAKPLSSSLLGWPIAIFKADHRDIIPANGVDAYLFVRYLRFCVRVFFPIWLVSWAILLPVNSIKTKGEGLSGLDIFVFGNIAPDKQVRYWAHLALAFLFTAWILYNMKQEMGHFIVTRQEFLISPEHSKSIQASTILITGIPDEYLTEKRLMEMYNHLPGGVRKIWLNRDLRELPELYERRLKACNKLEAAEAKLMRTAAKLRLKSKKPAGESALDIVPVSQRPRHSNGLPIIGKKVDTIEWARDEIAFCNKGLDHGRSTVNDQTRAGLGLSDPYPEDRSSGEISKPKAIIKAVKGDTSPSAFYPPVNSAFITFNQQIAAHLAKTGLAHHLPYRMSERWLDVAPADVIWQNLKINPYARKVRTVISYALTAALIIFWSIPVAFVGTVSNVPALCTQYSWLAWICKLPSAVVGIITGILPPALLVVLFMLLPIVLRLLARFEGIPKKTGVELSLMTRYFIFQVIHGFLIVSISSGIIKALPDLINSPGSVPTLLAKNLPSASIFFLTLIILKGLSGTAGGFLRLAPLVVYYIKLVLLGSSPRKIYQIKYGSSPVKWGTLFPNTTLLVVIALGYMVIAPIVNGLAFVTFFLFYQMYKHQFLWQFNIPPNSDTGGLFFPKAIQHTFVGLYVQQVCLAALFFLARDTNNKASAVIQGGLMIALIILTALFHIMLNNQYGPLVSALPLSLADRTHTAAPTTQTEYATTDYIKPAHQRDVEANDDDVISLAAEVDEDDLGGFAHPSVSRPQRVVWLPYDGHGMAEEEVQGCHAKGVRASSRGATMDEKGKVDIHSPPPYEE